jgi:hypothetical protein
MPIEEEDVMTQEFKVGDIIRNDDYDRLPIGASVELGLGFAAWTKGSDGLWRDASEVVAAAGEIKRFNRTLTHLPDATQPEDATDAYVEPEPLKEDQPAFDDDDVQRIKVTRGSTVLFDGLAVFREADNGEVIVTPVPRCTSLFVKPGSPLSGIVRCGQHEGHGHGHWTIGSDPAMSWNDAMEYGRMVHSGGAS